MYDFLPYKWLFSLSVGVWLGLGNKNKNQNHLYLAKFAHTYKEFDSGSLCGSKYPYIHKEHINMRRRQEIRKI